MKSHYSEFVWHCMRFYARHSKPEFSSPASRWNWEVCENVLKEFTEEERKILLFLFRERDTLPDNIYRISTERHIKQKQVWGLIERFEKRFAEKRWLI